PPAPRLVPLLLSLAVLAPAHSDPMYPRSEVGRFEVDGLDFRPNGAWRRETGRVRERRRALLAAGRVAQLNAPGAGLASRVGGQYLVPVIPIAFSNVAPPFPASAYQQVLFAAAPAPLPYSARSSHAEVPRGRVTGAGALLATVTADRAATHY